MSVFCRVAKWRRGNITSESSEKNETQKTAKLSVRQILWEINEKNVFPRRTLYFPAKFLSKVASPQKNQSLI